MGFVPICEQRRSNGSFTVGRETASKRLRATLLRVRTALRARMHEPVRHVGARLRSVVDGYFRYHAVPGNRPRSFLSSWCVSYVVAHAQSAQSIRASVGGVHGAAGSSVAACGPDSSPVSFSAIQRHSSTIGAVCGNSARTDLCGGRRASDVPTATRDSETNRPGAEPKVTEEDNTILWADDRIVP